MQFKDVINQKETKQHLMGMVQKNRLSHALLFLGKEGSGTLPLAIAFAQYVICEKQSAVSNQQSENESLAFSDSCGVCASCIKSNQLIHPDIHFSYPVIPKKAGDKPISTNYINEWRLFIKNNPYGNAYDWLQLINAENRQGNITAEECNDIIHKLNLKSFEGEYKILIMWMPEYLGKEGNKLLKLIEEPPPKTLFILVAEKEENILSTILSRCQLIKIPMPEVSEIENALQMNAGAELKTARQIASVAEGNYREAIQILQHTSEDWHSLLREWLNTILKAGPVAQLKWIDEINKLGREKQKQFLRYANHLFQQSVRIRLISESEIFLPENEKDFASRVNKIAGLGELNAIIEELDKASFYIERNANAKLLFHALTIKLYHIIQDKTLILNE